MLDQKLKERLKNIRAVALDGDGVIFTGQILEGINGSLGKLRSHADGQGISLLRSAGIPVACITGEKEIDALFLGKLVERWNNFPAAKAGKMPPVKLFSGVQREQKAVAAESWLREYNLALSDCAAIGDDISDYDLLQAVGFSAAPAQAEEVIKKMVHYVTPRRGGDGAVRDLANLILEAKGIDITTLVIR